MKLKIAHQSFDGLTWVLPTLPKGSVMETVGPIQKIDQTYERWAIYDVPDPSVEPTEEADGGAELLIKIPAESLKSFRMALTLRQLASVQLGLPEAFLYRVMKCIEEGKTEYTFTLKKQID